MKLQNTIIYLIGIPAVAAALRRRKDTPERKARLKDIDVTRLSWWLQGFQVLRVAHPNALTLDTTHSEPRQTAQRILEHLEGANQGVKSAAPAPAQ